MPVNFTTPAQIKAQIKATLKSAAKDRAHLKLLQRLDKAREAAEAAYYALQSHPMMKDHNERLQYHYDREDALKANTQRHYDNLPIELTKSDIPPAQPWS
jgi:hypothetical protein